MEPATTYTPAQPLRGLVGQKHGWTVRRARKAHHCAWCTEPTKRPTEGGGTYHDWPAPEHRRIQPGDLYIEGDVDPYSAGGFGHERICIACISKYESELRV